MFHNLPSFSPKHFCAKQVLPSYKPNLVTLGEWEVVACAVSVVFCQVANKRRHVGESSALKAKAQ